MIKAKQLLKIGYSLLSKNNILYSDSDCCHSEFLIIYAKLHKLVYLLENYAIIEL